MVPPGRPLYERGIWYPHRCFSLALAAAAVRLRRARPGAREGIVSVMTTTIALIVAAGRGIRLGAATPKQYLPLGGVAMLRRSVEAFLSHPAVGADAPFS